MCRVWLYLESHHFRDIRQCWFSSIHLQFEGLSITTYHLTQCNIPDIELYFTGHTTSKESVNGRINFLAMSIIGWSMSYILYMWYLCKKKKQHSQGRMVCGLEQIQQISDFIGGICMVWGCGMLLLRPVKKIFN